MYRNEFIFFGFLIHWIGLDFNFCMNIQEISLDKTNLSFGFILVNLLLKLNKTKLKTRGILGHSIFSAELSVFRTFFWPELLLSRGMNPSIYIQSRRTKSSCSISTESNGQATNIQLVFGQYIKRGAVTQNRLKCPDFCAKKIRWRPGVLLHTVIVPF